MPYSVLLKLWQPHRLHCLLQLKFIIDFTTKPNKFICNINDYGLGRHVIFRGLFGTAPTLFGARYFAA